MDDCCTVVEEEEGVGFFSRDFDREDLEDDDDGFLPRDLDLDDLPRDLDLDREDDDFFPDVFEDPFLLEDFFFEEEEGFFDRPLLPAPILFSLPSITLSSSEEMTSISSSLESKTFIR